MTKTLFISASYLKVAVIGKKMKLFFAVISALIIGGAVINVAPMVSVEAAHQ
jgi:hypothetical protein